MKMKNEKLVDLRFVFSRAAQTFAREKGGSTTFTAVSPRRKPQPESAANQMFRFPVNLLGALLFTAFLSVLCSNATAQSLWNDDSANRMFADKRAGKIGDIITVLVQENSTASKKNSTSTAKNNAQDASVSTFLYGAGAGVNALLSRGGSMPALKYNSKSTFDGGGKIDNSQNLVTSLAVRVIDVLPNGNLIIEGKRETAFSGEKQNAVLRGIVRVEDILSNNTIYSYNIADAKVEILSKGSLSDNQRRGWFTYLWNKLTPF